MTLTAREVVTCQVKKTLFRSTSEQRKNRDAEMLRQRRIQPIRQLVIKFAVLFGLVVIRLRCGLVLGLLRFTFGPSIDGGDSSRSRRL